MNMPDEIAILRATGHEEAAKILEAMRVGEVAAQPPAQPEAPAAPEATPGEAPLQTIEEWEALPQREQLERMGEVDVLLRQGS
jgi:hypothetical protein